MARCRAKHSATHRGVVISRHMRKGGGLYKKKTARK